MPAANLLEKQVAGTSFTVTPGEVVKNLSLSRIDQFICRQEEINMDPNNVVDNGDEEMLMLQGLDFSEVYTNRVMAADLDKVPCAFESRNVIRRQLDALSIPFAVRNLNVDVQLEIPTFEAKGTRTSLRFTETSPVKDDEDPMSKAQQAHVTKHRNKHNELAAALVAEVDTWIKYASKAGGYMDEKADNGKKHWTETMQDDVKKWRLKYTEERNKNKEKDEIIDSFKRGLGPSADEYKALSTTLDALTNAHRALRLELEIEKEKGVSLRDALDNSRVDGKRATEEVKRLREENFELHQKINTASLGEAVAKAELNTLKDCYNVNTRKRPRQMVPDSAERMNEEMPSPFPLAPFP